MSENEQILVLRKLIFEMALRMATLEKALLDKEIISLDEMSKIEESLAEEANEILNEK